MQVEDSNLNHHSLILGCAMQEAGIQLVAGIKILALPYGMQTAQVVSELLYQCLLYVILLQ